MIYESIINRRTIRKFTQQRIPSEVLKKCVDAARLSPSGMNRQPLKYIIINDPKRLPSVFSTLTWARNIPGYKHTPDEVPTAYIVILLDTEIRKQAGNDPGIAAMSISMVAHEAGLGSCMLGSVDRPRLQENLMVPNHLQIVLVVALDYPREKSKAVELKDNDTEYCFDAQGVLNVPKRDLDDIVVWNTFQT
ncbi:MAG: nitroreductase family protein [Candidatus Bathyarchaeota archaeon]|nr:nitroreductase family protein [Candidatus Bathyarchaeota archaeon]